MDDKGRIHQLTEEEHAALIAKIEAGSKPRMVPVPSESVGKIMAQSRHELQALHGPVTCPECARIGFDSCMPMGRGCLCPECEEEQP